MIGPEGCFHRRRAYRRHPAVQQALVGRRVPHADTASEPQVRNDDGERAQLLAPAVLEAAERLEGVLRSEGTGYVIVSR